MSLEICQLATHFTCQCLKCVGAFTSTYTSTTTSYSSNNNHFEEYNNNKTNTSIEDLYQLQFTTTVSAPLSVLSYQEESDSNQQQQPNPLFLNSSTTSSFNDDINNNNTFIITTSTVQQLEEEEQKFIPSSSSSSVVAEQESIKKEETAIPQVQEEQEQQIPQQQPKIKLSRRQRKQQHQKSFLDVAKSLRDSPKLFRNKPAQIEVSCNFYNEESKQYFLSRLDDAFRAKRRQFKRLRRRQYLPSWCYNQNDTSLRSIRDLCCVYVGGEEEYKVYDRRAIVSSWRLPRSTALAHRAKNRWIVRHRIFNCRKPFSNVYNWTDDATLNKPDPRGAVQHERNEKFNGKDGRERYNRNGGYHRRSYRGNSYHQGNQTYMGNSRKSIQGKPWLYNRQRKIFKGKDRVAEFRGVDHY